MQCIGYDRVYKWHINVYNWKNWIPPGFFNCSCSATTLYRALSEYFQNQNFKIKNIWSTVFSAVFVLQETLCMSLNTIKKINICLDKLWIKIEMWKPVYSLLCWVTLPFTKTKESYYPSNRCHHPRSTCTDVTVLYQTNLIKLWKNKFLKRFKWFVIVY